MGCVVNYGTKLRCQRSASRDLPMLVSLRGCYRTVLSACCLNLLLMFLTLASVFISEVDQSQLFYD